MEEEYDYVARHCKLNYLNVRTNRGQGRKIKQQESQRMNQNEEDREKKYMIVCVVRFLFFLNTVATMHTPKLSVPLKSSRFFQ